MQSGYAVMVVSVRGAGCSGGSFDFLSEQEARDGRDVIDWITGTGEEPPGAEPRPAQPWSNGNVALVGDSYTGFEQLPVAALRPEGLVAIAPGQPIADLYRDVGYPGGISNTLLPALHGGRTREVSDASRRVDTRLPDGQLTRLRCEPVEPSRLDGYTVLADKGFASADFEALMAELGAIFLRTDRKGEPARFGRLGGMRQWVESVFDTLEGQLSLEAHGARGMPA